MPDIDIDFPSNKRQNTIDYIKDKYGDERVAQVLTFIKIKGKGALKDVLRISGKCSFELMNKMTAGVPDEAAISDKLEDMKEDGGIPNIIRWSLENNPEDFAEWVQLDDKGSLTGMYSREFAQAMRLEGSRKAYGKHAAGLIVSDIPLKDVCPVFLDKSGKNKVVAFEFRDLEKLGFVKFDILATTVLDKLMGVNKLLEGGDFEDE
jgi:DNA polymerase-3 subunit alpha